MHYKRGDCESDNYNQILFLVFKSLKRFVYILIYTEHQLLWAHIHKPSHPVLIIPYTAEVSQARALSDNEFHILFYYYEQCACVYNAMKNSSALDIAAAVGLTCVIQPLMNALTNFMLVPSP